MHISQVKITNFRLLESAELILEDRTTLILGRNNSGKTSLTELFRRLLAENTPVFRLEDFSLSVYEHLWAAFLLRKAGAKEDEIRLKLPAIEVRITIRYSPDSILGPLGPFIIDLDPNCADAVIVIRYQLRDGEMGPFFENLESVDEKEKITFFRSMRERVPKKYIATVFAIDPNDAENRKQIDWPVLRTLLHSGFINAQRGLDDVTHRDRDVLGKVLEALLNTAMSDSADPKDRSLALKLEEAVKSVQTGIDSGFNKQLKDLFPAFSLFGYPGLSDPGLLTETTLDVQRLLTDHTKVHYAGVNGINLPESYNGLGVRNLIFILLKILEFFKSFIATPSAPGIHLIFIEEPEVHLHPQMQEVFIRKLGEIADVFAETFNESRPWPVQFVVTTHSTHIANEAPFESMRYFMTSPVMGWSGVLRTKIKDLRQGLGGTPKEDREFLHKYMTLTRCDLLFADKAVLIEGTTERLLLPKMVQKIDVDQTDGSKLSSQYISVVEVGGAYAHCFFGLLDFLEIRALIVTDLDSVKRNPSGKFIACKVSEGTGTSNACIKDWFESTECELGQIIAKSNDDKTFKMRRLTYQIPETLGGPCGRSFEQAFILANLEMFGLNDAQASDLEDKSWKKATDIKAKADFALQHAIDKTDWAVPHYIEEGLRWLAEGSLKSLHSALPPVIEAAVASTIPASAELDA